jgi:hypothetical protein
LSDVYPLQDYGNGNYYNVDNVNGGGDLEIEEVSDDVATEWRNLLMWIAVNRNKIQLFVPREQCKSWANRATAKVTHYIDWFQQEPYLR